jgi:MFS family permease
VIPVEPDGGRLVSLRWLIGSAFAALTGDGVRIAALPLYTAVSTHSPLAASAVAVAEVLPWLLVAVPAGALVDRGQPRRIVVTCHALRAVVVAALAVAVFTQHAGLPVLVVVAFLLTCGETFADAAFQSLLVSGAGPQRLEKANGNYVTAETIGLDLAGPLLAGALFAWQPAACFAVNALTYATAAVCVARLPRPAQPPPGQESAEPGTGFRRELLDGGRFLLGHADLRSLVLVVVLVAAAVSAGNALLPLYAVQSLGLRAALVPTVWVAQAIGTLLVARLLPALIARLGEGRVMMGTLLLLGAGFVVVGRAPVAWPVWLGYFVIGVGSGGWNVLSATRRQRLTPAPMMGRVTSSYRMLAWGLMPLGAAVAGPLARLTSLGAVFALAGGLVVLVALVLARRLFRAA